MGLVVAAVEAHFTMSRATGLHAVHGHLTADEIRALSHALATLFGVTGLMREYIGTM